MISPDTMSSSLAYIDPFSGSLLLQIILAGVAGIGVFIKFVGTRFLGVLMPWRKKNQESPASGEASGETEAGPQSQQSSIDTPA